MSPRLRRKPPTRPAQVEAFRRLTDDFIEALVRVPAPLEDLQRACGHAQDALATLARVLADERLRS